MTTATNTQKTQNIWKFTKRKSRSKSVPTVTVKSTRDPIEKLQEQVHDGAPLLSDIGKTLSTLDEALLSINSADLRKTLSNCVERVKHLQDRVTTLPKDDKDLAKQIGQIAKFATSADQAIGRLDTLKKLRTQLTRLKTCFGEYITMSENALGEIPPVLLSFCMQNILYWSGDIGRIDIGEFIPANKIPITFTQWIHTNKSRMQDIFGQEEEELRDEREGEKKEDQEEDEEDDIEAAIYKNLDDLPVEFTDDQDQPMVADEEEMNQEDMDYGEEIVHDVEEEDSIQDLF